MTTTERDEIVKLLRDGLTVQAIARLKELPCDIAPPVVEWVDRGCVWSAVVGEFSLVVYPSVDCGWWYQIFRGGAYVTSMSTEGCVDAAKRAAEKRLGEVMGGAK